jgi:hypothetical protein
MFEHEMVGGLSYFNVSASILSNYSPRELISTRTGFRVRKWWQRLPTLLDDGDNHGWLKALNGEIWATATLKGAAHAVADTTALVRWEVADGVDV